MDKWEKIIIGIDPGTNVMGYGILGVNGKTPQAIAMGVLKLDKFETHYLRLRRIFERAKTEPKRVVFGEANTDNMLKAAAIAAKEGVRVPVLLGNEEMIAKRADRMGMEI